MGHKQENRGFTCVYCGKYVPPCDAGSYRNHCPYCLHSVHVDIIPGDRNSTCGGDMEPIGIHFHSKKGIQIIHQCLNCGEMKRNRLSEYDSVSDSKDEIMKLINRVK